MNDVEVERRAGGKLFHARGPARCRKIDTSVEQNVKPNHVA